MPVTNQDITDDQINQVRVLAVEDGLTPLVTRCDQALDPLEDPGRISKAKAIVAAAYNQYVTDGRITP